MSELNRLKREYKLELARKWIYISAFSFLLIMGITLVLINTVYSHVSTQNHVENVLEETKQVSATQIEGNKTVIEDTLNKESNITVSNQGTLSDSKEKSSDKISYNFDVISPISSMSYDAKFNTSLVIGQLYIPEIELNLPILEGISKDNLYNGASTLKSNQTFKEGNFSLASFNVSEESFLFSNLKTMTAGQSIYATDKQTVYEYEISTISEVKENISKWISDDKSKTITLITHSNGNEDSYIVVQADFKYSYSINEATKELTQVFLPK